MVSGEPPSPQFANINSTLDALKANLENIQRDDNKIRDFAVEPFTLSEQTRAKVPFKWKETPQHVKG